MDAAALKAKIDAEAARFHDNATLFVTKGNKAAGVRSRTASKELGKLLKEWRKLTVKGCGNGEA